MNDLPPDSTLDEVGTKLSLNNSVDLLELKQNSVGMGSVGQMAELR
jgi:hypothetical protein